jgi:hypothetical protein
MEQNLQEIILKGKNKDKESLFCLINQLMLENFLIIKLKAKEFIGEVMEEFIVANEKKIK